MSIAEGQILQAGPSRESLSPPRLAESLPGSSASKTCCPQKWLPVASAPAIFVIDADVGEMPEGTAVLWSVRPERVTLATNNDPRYPANVIDIADLGTSTALTIRLAGGPELRVRSIDPVDLLAGDACGPHRAVGGQRVAGLPPTGSDHSEP